MTIAINKKFDNVDDGIQNMLSAANHDYTKFLDNEEMHKEFVGGWVIKQGNKYIKILTRNGSSAWGFVVNTDNDKKFTYLLIAVFAFGWIDILWIFGVENSKEYTWWYLIHLFSLTDL